MNIKLELKLGEALSS